MQTAVPEPPGRPPHALNPTAANQTSQASQASQETTPMASPPHQLRPVTQTMRIHETSEGLGSHVRCCIGNSKVRCLPPFIKCDLFRINDVGRPPHPSRGSQKITAVLDGSVSIEYSPSDVIEQEAGNVTSLMVGRGALRSMRAVVPTQDSHPAPPDPPITTSYATKPMPRPEATGLNVFMDVPEPFKRMDSSHIDLCHADLESFSPRDGVHVRLLTGSAFDRTASQMLTATPATILDITIEPDASIDIPVSAEWNAFIFVVEGKAIVQGEKRHKYDYVEFKRATLRRSERRRNKLFEQNKGDDNGKDKDRSASQEGESTHSQAQPKGPRAQKSQADAVVEISVDAKASEKTRLFFCAAEPLCQPIYRQGPFVDVSMDGIQQAFDDYTEQRNGFETRRVWQNGSQLDGAASTANGAGDSETEPYNPCDEGPPLSGGEDEEDSNLSDEDELGMSCKATYPNAFPPGKANPAENSTEFNDNESIEAQQERKVPKRHRSGSVASEDGDREAPDLKREKKGRDDDE